MKENIEFAIGNFVGGFTAWGIINQIQMPNQLAIGIMASIVGALIFYKKNRKTEKAIFWTIISLIKCFGTFLLMTTFGLMMSYIMSPIVHALYFEGTAVTLKQLTLGVTGTICVAVQILRVYGNTLMDAIHNRISRKKG